MFVYDIYDIDRQCYLLPIERMELCATLGIPHVPILSPSETLQFTQEELISIADGEGMNKGVKREGLVWKHLHSDFSFKCISNTYLLKNKNA